VTQPLLPGDHRVANVAETIRWQRLSARLPTETDRAAELSIPKPAPIARQARDPGPIRQHHGFAFCLSVDKTGQKRRAISGDLRELLVSGCLPTHIVMR